MNFKKILSNVSYCAFVVLVMYLLTLCMGCKKSEGVHGTSPIDSIQSGFTMTENQSNYAMASDSDVYMQINFTSGSPAVAYSEKFYQRYVNNFNFFTDRIITRFESVNGSAYVQADQWTTTTSTLAKYSFHFTAWRGGASHPENSITATSTIQ